MSYSFGAVARGETGATVEHHEGRYLLAVVRGRLATPALESIKAVFFRLTTADDDAANELCAAAPTMIADAVAIVLIADGQVYVACAGDGGVLRQRAGATALLTGAHALTPGDDVIASATSLGVGDAFFGAPAARSAEPFHNDALDTEISTAAAVALADTFAIAAVRSPA